MTYSTNVPLLSKLCCKNGTESDWHVFYSHYRGLIAKWCSQSGLPSSDFDDVFHDVLIKIVDAIPNYDRSKGHRFRSWLKTVVMNALIDRIRLSKHRPIPKPMSDSQLQHAALQETAKKELDSLADQLTEQSTSAAEILARVEKRVKPETWSAFVRRELLDDAVEDIASELAIKKASVYQSSSRVRALIKEESTRFFGED